MLRMALVHGQSMNRCCMTFEICFCWTYADASSFLLPSGDCDHYDRVLRVAGLPSGDPYSLPEFSLLAVKPLPLGLAI